MKKIQRTNLLFNNGFKTVRTSDWNSKEYPKVVVTKLPFMKVINHEYYFDFTEIKPKQRVA